LSFFKKLGELFKAPPPRDAHSNWFYYNKTFTKTLLIFYRSIIEKSRDGSISLTAETIAPPELRFNMSTADVIKLWGKPRCSFNNNKEASNIQVFFYRRNFVYENALTQLQFYNNRLFFCSVEVGKSMMAENAKINMLNNMLPNYVSLENTTALSIPVYEDANHNFLLVQDEVLLNICYLSGEFAGNHLALLEEAKKHAFENNSLID